MTTKNLNLQFADIIGSDKALREKIERSKRGDCFYHKTDGGFITIAMVEDDRVAMDGRFPTEAQAKAETRRTLDAYARREFSESVADALRWFIFTKSHYGIRRYAFHSTAERGDIDHPYYEISGKVIHRGNQTMIWETPEGSTFHIPYSKSIMVDNMVTVPRWLGDELLEGDKIGGDEMDEVWLPAGTIS